MKYKVGDKVRVRKDLCRGKDYYMADGRTSNTAVSAMIALSGETVEIEAITSYGQYKVKGSVWNWTDGMFEDVRTKVVITVDGNTTLARLYENDKVIKSASAKCSPEDTFDFSVGAKLAFDRLMGEEEKVEDKTEKFNVGDIAWLKPFDEVKDPVGMDCYAWDKMRERFVRIKSIESNGNFLVDTCYHGPWYVSPQALVKLKVGDKARVVGNDDDFGSGYDHHYYEKGTIVVIDSVENHCFHCRREMPGQSKLRQGVKHEHLVPVFESEEKKEPEHKPFKVVCTKSEYTYWTVGKVYEIVDGKMIDDDGDERTKLFTFNDIETKLNNPFHRYLNFIPFVE